MRGDTLKDIMREHGIKGLAAPTHGLRRRILTAVQEGKISVQYLQDCLEDQDTLAKELKAEKRVRLQEEQGRFKLGDHVFWDSVRSGYSYQFGTLARMNGMVATVQCVRKVSSDRQGDPSYSTWNVTPKWDEVEMEETGFPKYAKLPLYSLKPYEEGMILKDESYD